jgi:hypothetical protein
MPKAPATIQKDLTTTLKEGTPIQRLFGETFEQLGGQDFFTDWAEENPTMFIQMLIAQQPQHHAPAGNTANVINIHPGLAPGPLDAKVVSDQ